MNSHALNGLTLWAVPRFRRVDHTVTLRDPRSSAPNSTGQTEAQPQAEAGKREKADKALTLTKTH